jgi:hypothetical protein
VAYITWEYSFIGSQNFGVGTGDWIDDEVSMLADPRLLGERRAARAARQVLKRASQPTPPWFAR